MEIAVIEWILSGAIVVIGFFLGKTIRDFEKRFEKLEKEQKGQNREMADLKDNYLSRFADVKETQHLIKDEILAAIGELNIKLEKQRQFCYLIQEQKRGTK